uniref:Sec-independent translocase component C n=1 Tax=Rhodogorgon sp. TaxID=2485824 RepID=A0A3G3MI09_9FLOR|nr:Sec-independent translocase component C [Rhodogorgon sp.]
MIESPKKQLTEEAQKKLTRTNNDFEMSIFEHLEELRERTIKSLIFLICCVFISFIYTKEISSILKQPATGIKFLQLAPGEYFFSSIKIAIYSGLIISSPFIIYQIILFIIPGLTTKEIKVFLPILVVSVFLFFMGTYFSYTFLVPAALHFFITYGSDIVEPIWSFEQYFDFISALLLSTGLAFQLPVLQIIIGLLGVISSKDMLSFWKYIVLVATIISAILTPSTDPFTQLTLSLAILMLYFSSILILKILNR